MKRAPWLAEVLRDAGLEVVEHVGWERRGRDFVDLTHVTWHHDGSPVGDSPGVPAYMLRQMAAGKAGAQLWVSRRGVWHILASGVAFHAGTVLPGKPGNARSLGVEADHTTGERWPQAQLDSMRIGTAAILVRMGRSETGLEFHSTVCHPVGRKTDPDGLSLLAERARVGTLLVPRVRPAVLIAKTVIAPTVQEDDMTELVTADGTKLYLSHPFFGARHIFTIEEFWALVEVGHIKPGAQAKKISPERLAALIAIHTRSVA